MMEFENHNFTITTLIGSAKNYQWILKLGGESLMRSRIVIVSKYLLKNDSLITKGKMALL